MRKISKWYCIASALLAVWGALDLYHYFAVGRNLVMYYSGESVILSLVLSSLFQGIIKLLLAAIVMAAGFMRAGAKKRPCSLRAATLAICLGAFAVWFASAAAVTIKSALDYSDYYEEKSSIYSAAMSLNGLEEYEDSTYPGAFSYKIWRTLAYGSNNAYRISANSGSFVSEENVDWQSAAAVYDGDGNLISSSGSYIIFAYDTEEFWESATSDMAMRNSGYVRADVNFEEFDKSIFNEFHQNYSWSTLLGGTSVQVVRLTGTFEGYMFHADKIECVLRDEFRLALNSLEPDSHYFDDDGTEVIEYFSRSDREVIETMDDPWRTIYDSGSETQGAVTIYTDLIEVSDYELGGTVSYKGTVYDNLASLLLSMGTTRNLDVGASNLLHQRSSFNLLDTVIFEETVIYDYDNLVEIDIGLTPARKYIITTAVRCSPLGAAVKSLTALYLVTFLAAAGAALWLRHVIGRRLIDPIVTVGEELVRESSPYAAATAQEKDWQEVSELYTASSDAQMRLLGGKIEINRLNTALDYAKTAEENRRQMTSNIAHELKTPLAVIHSYAEGLKEHIADDKRDKYLDVILSESERMDAMVLEMLDLSRLEAGKVKLSRDSFSLAELTQGIFDKLERAAEAKELHIEYEFKDTGTVIADESRIGQVIENFATNAIKYTPPGGSILVRVDGSRFAIANDSEPLSDEALSKVWDTFYRTDEARTKVGTGLGLAIAKSIIELHGGKCSARNTETGVEFGFTI